MSGRQPVVTGVGAVWSGGESAAELARAIREGPRGTSTAPCESTAAARAEGEARQEFGPGTRGIRGFDLSRHVPSVKSYIDRTSALALAATHIALSDAGLLEPASRRGRELGLAYATQWGCLDSMELFYAKLRGANPRFAPPLPFSHSYANSPASIVSIEFGLRGHHIVFSTGRTSAAWALLGAADAVTRGRAEAIACAGSDSLSRAAFAHYQARGRLPPGDRSGDGSGADRFLLSEGAGCLVIESGEFARERGASARAAVLGAGAATGGSTAAALAEASREALLRAGLLPGDVRAGVGTAAHRSGREAEAEALELALELPPEKARGLYSSAGTILGETMGASATLAAAAVCAGGAPMPALVLCAELEEDGAAASAVAILLGPCEGT